MEEVNHLANERSKAQFDVEAMKIVWAGSQQQLDASERIARLVATKITERHLHWGMFIPAIKGQGTEQQQQKWLPLSYKMQIIGCYAQTELGHGSNVQGLKTTATLDPKSDEFIINSPTLTSSKWWPGGLGKASTHGVVYARLLVDEKDCGVNNGFIVHLRSFDDPSPLPGITVADIGMKFGNEVYNTIDNGVLQFDHVSIPRDQMLMRVSQVTREGKYVQSDVPRQLLYGTMVYVWQTIVADASCALSRAVCIATRYSAVQRQFGSQDGGPETQVIDYKTQQNRLFPLVTTACAYSGIPELFVVYVPACTYEGDNVVLLLQVARFLMKIVSQLGSGKQPVGTTAYMGRVEHLLQCCSEDWLKPTAILEAFEARAACMSVACAKNISKMPSLEEGFAELSSNLVETAVAHCQLIGARPNAIALVDAFNYTDHYLGSVLGRYDGNVYPNLYAKAWEEPLNDTAVSGVYREYIRPMLKQQLRTARL
ncbi:hypothetical protein GIB67_042620 [Kingdonia uniflora]|uniref:Acyl-coenzyme A oxidase n=1 Tax=Kingdonia uniflora TaxID=39325 RepID=A0A7J7M1C1_9MAGN|nr:hypothetical protein GIB67_028117 [Kingdonia uniflora]KAF6148661.1 hypothetical protein GIB67_042620 [Kingdonia uniflora]